jgi:hypothetical protein
MLPTKTYAIKAPAGPDLAIAPPLPMKRPVPMVPPVEDESHRQAASDGMGVPMAIICKCLDFNFRFNVGWCVTTNFSTSEPASAPLVSSPPVTTGWMISSWPIIVPLESSCPQVTYSDGIG